jgi:nucleoside 2-deoxyribosyltransferase
MEKLKDIHIYISGAIDRVSDDGIGWRQEIRKKCEQYNLPVVFLDPTDKPVELGSEIGIEKKRMEQLKSGGRELWELAQKEVKQFKRIDYRMVDRCDLFIIYIDISVHMCGSYFECKVAEEQRKPIFVILAKSMIRKDLPTWLIDLVNYDHIFLDINDVVEYLDKMNNEEIPLDNRWIKVD